MANFIFLIAALAASVPLSIPLMKVSRMSSSIVIRVAICTFGVAVALAMGVGFSNYFFDLPTFVALLATAFLIVIIVLLPLWSREIRYGKIYFDLSQAVFWCVTTVFVSAILSAWFAYRMHWPIPNVLIGGSVFGLIPGLQLLWLGFASIQPQEKSNGEN